MKVLVIDNYDSFTYNLVQYLEELGAHTFVFRNDKIDLEEIEKLKILIELLFLQVQVDQKILA